MQRCDNNISQKHLQDMSATIFLKEASMGFLLTLSPWFWRCFFTSYLQPQRVTSKREKSWEVRGYSDYINDLYNSSNMTSPHKSP